MPSFRPICGRSLLLFLPVLGGFLTNDFVESIRKMTAKAEAEILCDFCDGIRDGEKRFCDL